MGTSALMHGAARVASLSCLSWAQVAAWLRWREILHIDTRSGDYTGLVHQLVDSLKYCWPGLRPTKKALSGRMKGVNALRGVPDIRQGLLRTVLGS